MFGLGTMELGVVLLIALLLFGKRLPAALGSLGTGIRVFRKALRGEDDELVDGNPRLAE